MNGNQANGMDSLPNSPGPAHATSHAQDGLASLTSTPATFTYASSSSLPSSPSVASPNVFPRSHSHLRTPSALSRSPSISWATHSRGGSRSGTSGEWSVSDATTAAAISSQVARVTRDASTLAQQFTRMVTEIQAAETSMAELTLEYMKNLQQSSHACHSSVRILLESHSSWIRKLLIASQSMEGVEELETYMTRTQASLSVLEKGVELLLERDAKEAARKEKEEQEREERKRIARQNVRQRRGLHDEFDIDEDDEGEHDDDGDETDANDSNGPLLTTSQPQTPTSASSSTRRIHLVEPPQLHLHSALDLAVPPQPEAL